MPAPILETTEANRRANLRMPVDFLQQQGRLVTRHGTFIVRMNDVSAGGYGVELIGLAPRFKNADADLDLDGEIIPVTICHVQQNSGTAFVGLRRRDWSPSDEQIAIQKARIMKQYRHVLLYQYVSDPRTLPLLLAIVATSIILIYASGILGPGYGRHQSYSTFGDRRTPDPARERVAGRFARGVTPSEEIREQLKDAARPSDGSGGTVVPQTLTRLEQLGPSPGSATPRSSDTPLLVAPAAASFVKSFLSRHPGSILERDLTDGLQRLTARGNAVVNGPAQTGQLKLGDETTLRVRWSRTSEGIVIEELSETNRAGD